MSLSNLEEMEERLKGDILAEASRYQGNVLVHDELDEEVISMKRSPSENIADLSIALQTACPMWEAISPESVKTPKEAFFGLQNEGYRVCSLNLSFSLCTS